MVLGGFDIKEFMKKKVGPIPMSVVIGFSLFMLILIAVKIAKSAKKDDKTKKEGMVSGAGLARVQPNNRAAFYAARSDGYGEPSEDYARSVEGFRVKDAWKSGREGLLARRHGGPWLARRKYREANDKDLQAMSQ